MPSKTESISELNYLNQCCQDIESKLNWGEAGLWTNSNFLDLSNEVKRSSGLRISAATLKRIFGKVKTTERYNPQLATKNALAQFLGYESWSEYKIANPIVSEVTIISPTEFTVLPKGNSRRFMKISVFALLLVSIFFAVWYFNDSKVPQGDFTISGKYLEGNAYHTVVFDYDIAKLNAEKVYLDFGDSSRKVLPKRANTISHYYRSPGFYKVKLLAENNVLYDTTVTLSTNGWEAYIYYVSPAKITEYLPVPNFIDSLSGAFSIPRSTPEQKGIDTTKMYWTQFVNVQEFGVDGDGFSLSAELKNDYEIVAARCNHLKMIVVGEHEKIELYFLREGCFKWSKLQFSEVALDGEYEDLSAFGKDFLDWKKVGLNVEKKTAKVFYNGQVIFEQAYKRPLGKIKEVRFQFSGTGGGVRGFQLEVVE
ncbi:hypothetical protein R9C00_12500 [Flammeovirgaceae bacterium SG7u.111]|nr:hypothetical protein [Flammeovirgaceae bacterium SG7u.132]WPO38273.1 hypothetical protein R9C00_12500 [Flammeovirgaceae bacterium SG7u.111]